MQSEMISAGRGLVPLADVLEGVVGTGMSHGLSRNARAAAAWLMSNGDTERRHTNRVWLRDSPRKGVPPVLVVEVDSHSLMSDFNAKRDMYLGRLANYGQQVSRIEFRYAPPAAAAADPPAAPTETDDLPPLDAAGRERVDELAATVEEPLRPVVRRAIEATLRRAQDDTA